MRRVLLNLLPLFLLVGLAACGREGPAGVPVISSFSATPATIPTAGAAVTLNWTVSGAVTELNLSADVGTSPGAVSGTSLVVNPAATTTYTLTASNSAGDATKTTTVTVGGAPPGGENGQPPTGTIGVGATATGPFQNDATGNITSPSDPRILRVEPNSTFYAQVAYSDPGGVAGIRLRLANSSPAGLGGDLVPGQEVGGFTLGAETTGCVLDGTQTSVSCVYEIQVGAIPNITALPGAGGEFAYVFRTNVTDAAGSESNTPPRGYVIVGDAGPTPPPPTPDAPSIDAFTASPGTIAAGESSSLAWDISGAVTSLTLSSGIGDVTGEDSQTVSPDATTTYTLTATNAAGSDSETVTVTVADDDELPSIDAFTASPATIAAGESSSLAWDVSGEVTSLTLDEGIGSVTGEDSQTVSPDETTTYTLTATNAAGSVTANATVTVAADPGPPTEPVITSFTANGAETTEIAAGDEVVLAWDITGEATEVTITGVEQENLADEADQAVTVFPTEDTTYLINASNSAGAASTQQATVLVTAGGGGGGGGGGDGDLAADFEFEISGLTVVFRSQTEGSNGDIASYSWAFGDDAIGSGAGTEHEYAEPGTYSVRLVVRDDMGNADTVVKQVTVPD